MIKSFYYKSKQNVSCLKGIDPHCKYPYLFAIATFKGEKRNQNNTWYSNLNPRLACFFFLRPGGERSEATTFHQLLPLSCEGGERLPGYLKGKSTRSGKEVVPRKEVYCKTVRIFITRVFRAQIESQRIWNERDKYDWDWRGTLCSSCLVWLINNSCVAHSRVTHRYLKDTERQKNETKERLVCSPPRKLPTRKKIFANAHVVLPLY